MTAATPTPSPSTRRWEIDALRGLMLVLMTVTHLPTQWAVPLGQPLGHVSAAEGFVLLSACMAGLAYGRLAQRSGVAAMRRAFWRRAVTLYGCHALALLFLFSVIAFIGIRVDQPAVKNLMAFYIAEPLQALAGGLLLVYEPPLLDILPLYVLFMLASPWVLSLALRRGWAPVMAGSLLLWLLAQFGFSPWLYEHVMAPLPLSIPFSETGSFNMWAWQFLWLLGLWMGASRNDPAAPRFAFPAWAVWVAGVVALACFAWRHAVGQVPFPRAEWLNPLFDKWLLGPLRLIDLMALMLLAIHFGPWLAARLPRVRWIEELGRASLPVFCAHLAAVLLALGLYGDQPRPVAQDLALLALCFGLLYAVAWVALRVKPERPRAAPRMAGRAIGA